MTVDDQQCLPGILNQGIYITLDIFFMEIYNKRKSFERRLVLKRNVILPDNSTP